MLNDRTLRWAYPIFIVLTVLLNFRHDLLGNMSLSLDNGDNYLIHFAYYAPMIEALEKYGSIDPWNDYIWGGVQALGNPNALTNAILFLLMLLGKAGFTIAMNWHLMFEISLAGIGMFFLLRELKFPQPLTLMGPLMYIFSTCVTTTMAWYGTLTHVATIPWVLRLLLTLDQREHWKTSLYLSLIFYVQFTYGQLQMTIYSFYFFLVFLLWVYRERTSTWPVFKILFCAGVVGLLLSAHSILPLTEFLGAHEDRTNFKWLEQGREHRVNGHYLINFFMPHLFWGEMKTWWPYHINGWTHWSAFMVWFGLPFSLLSLTALVFVRSLNDPVVKRLLVFVLVFTVLVSTNVGGIVITLMSGKHLVPTSRIVQFFLIPLILISLRMLYTVFHNPIWFKRYCKVVAGFGLFLLVFMQTAVHKAYAKSFFMDAARKFKFDGQAAFDTFWVTHGGSMKNIILNRLVELFPILLLLLTCWVLRRKLGQRRWVLIIFGAISILPAVEFQDKTRIKGHSKYPFTELFTPQEPLIMEVLSKPDLQQYQTNLLLNFGAPDLYFKRNQNSYYHLPLIGGYTSVNPRVNALEPYQRQRNDRQNPYTENFLKILSIKYILRDDRFYEPLWFYGDRVSELQRRGPYTLYAYNGALPRFYFPERIESIPDQAARVARLKETDFDPLRLSLSTRTDYRKPSGCFPSVHIQEKVMSAWRLKVFNPCSDDVVLALHIPRHPWWQVTLNGEIVEDDELNYLHRGIEIPPGVHEVFTPYQPKTWRAGIGISIVTLLSVFGTLFLASLRRRKL